MVVTESCCLARRVAYVQVSIELKSELSLPQYRVLHSWYFFNFSIAKTVFPLQEERNRSRSAAVDVGNARRINSRSVSLVVDEPSTIDVVAVVGRSQGCGLPTQPSEEGDVLSLEKMDGGIDPRAGLVQ